MYSEEGSDFSWWVTHQAKVTKQPVVLPLDWASTIQLQT